ncbi:hypothetical protein ACJO5Y_01205 [Marinobacter sp. GN3S48]|uniref:hypothetical protein n=1 Tax=Marinobacter sp. GN3S48 TaxID=3382302 RepID=UPI00387B8115
MNLVILTKKGSGWPRPLWIEVSIDLKYINKIKEISKCIVNKGCGNEVVGATGVWHARREFINYKLEAVCEREKVKFRLVNMDSYNKVYSNGILIDTLYKLNKLSNNKQRVFYSNDQPVLMAIYYSTKKVSNSY